jgi:hypothetical protein
MRTSNEVRHTSSSQAGTSLHSVKSSSHSHVVGSFFATTVDDSKVAALIGFKVAGRCKLAKRVGTKALVLVLAIAKSKNAGRLLPIIMLDLVIFIFEEGVWHFIFFQR